MKKSVARTIIVSELIICIAVVIVTIILLMSGKKQHPTVSPIIEPEISRETAGEPMVSVEGALHRMVPMLLSFGSRIALPRRQMVMTQSSPAI